MTGDVIGTVKEVIRRTHNVKSIRVDVGKRLAFKAGQFLSAAFKGESECKRWLSISNSPTEEGYIEFTKKLTQSDFSEKLEAVKPGDKISLRYPFGKFTLEDNLGDMRTGITYLSGGIGITPIRSMCRYAVDKKLGTDIILVYANRSINDIVFREDFEEMQRRYDKLKVVNVLCESAPGFNCVVGVINSEMVKKAVPDYTVRKFYLCGPPPMVEAMRRMLVGELSLPKENIITENFQGYES